MDKVPPDTTGIAAANPPDGRQKVRLLTMGDLDGRTMAAKAVRTLIGDLESDLGGAERLSASEREIVRRTALASAMLQDMEAHWLSGRGVDVAAYTTLSNTQSRLLKLLGLQRRPRDVTPDLAAYVAAKAAAQPAKAAPVVLPPPPGPAQ